MMNRCSLLAALLSLLLLSHDGTVFSQQVVGVSVVDSEKDHDNCTCTGTAAGRLDSSDPGPTAAAVAVDLATAFHEAEPSVVSVTVIGLSTYSWGTGVIIDESGIVLTCEHTFRDFDGKQVYVILSDRRVYRSRILGRDAVLDVAVLQILADDRRDDHLDHIFRQFATVYDHDMPERVSWNNSPLFSHAKLGNSSSVRLGSRVLAIGSDVSRGNEAHAGIVTSHATRSGSNDHGVEYFFTDAAVYHGHSGGPLIDIATNAVTGILSHICIDAQSRDERNAAIAIDQIKEVLPRLMEGETITHGTIGKLSLLGLTHDLPQGALTAGAEIIEMESYSRAGRAGLRRNDVIVEIGGQEVKNARDARRLIDQAVIGRKLEIVVMRKGITRLTRKVVRVVPYAKGEQEEMPRLRVLDWFRIKFKLM